MNENRNYLTLLCQQGFEIMQNSLFRKVARDSRWLFYCYYHYLVKNQRHTKLDLHEKALKCEKHEFRFKSFFRFMRALYVRTNFHKSFGNKYQLYWSFRTIVLQCGICTFFCRRICKCNNLPIFAKHRPGFEV